MRKLTITCDLCGAVYESGGENVRVIADALLEREAQGGELCNLDVCDTCMDISVDPGDRHDPSMPPSAAYDLATYVRIYAAAGVESFKNDWRSGAMEKKTNDIIRDEARAGLLTPTALDTEQPEVH